MKRDTHHLIHQNTNPICINTCFRASRRFSLISLSPLPTTHLNFTPPSRQVSSHHVDAIYWSSAKGSIKDHPGLIAVSKKDLYFSPDHKNDYHATVIDAAGKSPSGLTESTLTSYGNYNLCLESKSIGLEEEFYGSYCMIEMFPIKRKAMMANDTMFDLGSVSGVPGFPFPSSLCVPSTCSVDDLRQILPDIMKPYRFKVKGFLTCDTMNSTSFSHRLEQMTIHQKVSL